MEGSKKNKGKYAQKHTCLNYYLNKTDFPLIIQLQFPQQEQPLQPQLQESLQAGSQR